MRNDPAVPVMLAIDLTQPPHLPAAQADHAGIQAAIRAARDDGATTILLADGREVARIVPSRKIPVDRNVDDPADAMPPWHTGPEWSGWYPAAPGIISRHFGTQPDATSRIAALFAVIASTDLPILAEIQELMSGQVPGKENIERWIRDGE